MKKLLFICIVIVGIVFIAGCIGEEKTSTSGVAENSRSSGILLNPSNLLNGYYSSNFQSYAISEAESFEIRPDFIEGSIRSTQNKFESEIPAGKKRVITYFDLYNEDATIGMRTTIYESDSNSKLKDYISKIYESRNKEYYTLCSVGENCIQHIEGSSTEVSSEFIFSIKNRYVSIWAGNAGRGQVITKEKLQTETLKVAEAIKSKID